MAFMDFFSANKQQQPANNQQQQQQQPQNNQQQQQPNQPQGNQGATVPNMGGQGNGQNAQNQQQPNPLDSYSKMFDNANTDGDKPPSFTIDPKIMDQVVSSQDFTKGINPEVMQKALQGDAQSMMEIMQSVGRNAYRASIEHGGMLTDKFVGARETYGSKGLSSKVRQELTTHALSSTPNFQHPVVKKQLSEIAQRLQTQHPDATPQEIADMAKQYVTELASALNPESNDKNKGQAQEPEVRDEEYWNKFFN